MNNAFSTLVNKLWNTHKPLTAVGFLMLTALVVSVAGIFLDQRIITGAPAWLKPAKFALSTAIYAFTVAWIMTYLDPVSRIMKICGSILATALVIEVVIIDLQAMRGVTSHFNFDGALNTVLWRTMGVVIFTLLITSIVFAARLFLYRFADPSWGAALKAGMLVTIIGSAMAGFMTPPTRTQIDHVKKTGEMKVIGAHTVGAPDGGKGLPVTGWSREHGDLRIAHFIGLHGAQVVPLLSWALWRLQRWTQLQRRRSVIAITVSYVVMICILVWQALRGQSMINPDNVTLMTASAWLAATIGALLAIVMDRKQSKNRIYTKGFTSL